MLNFLFPKPTMPAAAEMLPGREGAVLPAGAAHFINGRPLQPPYPDGLEIAGFGMGCFWGAEKKFWSLPGVWVTAVGYQGGATANATYEEACSGRTGHAEVVRVVYDPATITYERLLKTFWESHDPTQGFRQGNDVGTQYRSAIFAHGEEQLAAARASRDLYGGVLGSNGFGEITTEIADAPAFYFAESYHQQYLAKNPNGYDCHTATGVACPIGLGVAS
jgi:peptide-methionine (S)-S-oxide reductase